MASLVTALALVLQFRSGSYTWITVVCAAALALAVVFTVMLYRILPIEPDGTLSGLPDRYGPVKVHIVRDADNPKNLQGVVLSSPGFRVSLSQCVLRHLHDVSRIQASGSWYHTRSTLPPYVTLTFHTGRYVPASGALPYYSVTFSLLDGHILMGARAWDPPLGDWRARVIDPADKCAHWERIGMRSDDSLRPTPLRGSARSRYQPS